MYFPKAVCPSLAYPTNLKDVADILGHVKIETTENYYIMSTKDNRNDIAIISENLFQLDIENF